MEPNKRLAEYEFVFRENGEFVTKKTSEIIGGKRVIIFSLPGAFTPTCTNYQLPGFDDLYDEFKKQGIDDIYCISVNDGFVMNAWAKELGIENVKMIPDGNADFTDYMDMLVGKYNCGFGERSWRYAMVVDDMVVEKMFIEKGKCDDATEDPYEETTPAKLLEYVKSRQTVSV
ncbi:MAG: peroxiredoxin [Candidatus Nanopelagicaceae bacterium]